MIQKTEPSLRTHEHTLCIKHVSLLSIMLRTLLRIFVMCAPRQLPTPNQIEIERKSVASTVDEMGLESLLSRLFLHVREPLLRRHQSRRAANKLGRTQICQKRRSF
jgi:hypothetical protein